MRVLSGFVALALLAVACGGGTTGPTAQPTGAGPTGAPTGGQPTGQPTAAPTTAPTGAPTAAPTAAPPGARTVAVTLTGGPDAGAYTGAENPNCSFGLVGPGIWGTQYSTDSAGEGQLSSVQTIVPPEGDSDAHFSMTVTIGPLFNGNDYVLTEDNGSAQISDAGATAVIHVTGTTEDGVAVDATVTCPTVMRF